MIEIREIRQEDAEKFLDLRKQLDTETRFMMLEPGERQTTPEEQREMIEKWLAQKNNIVLVGEDEDGRLVGFLTAAGGTYRRNRHNVYIVIGVLEAYTGQGVGTRLFESMEERARSLGLHRMELTVLTHNDRAVALYRKMGFEVEGIKQDSLFIDDDYVDEYFMVKLI